MHHLKLFYYLMLVIINSALWLTTFIFFLRHKERATVFFLVFSLLNSLHFSMVFLDTYIRNNPDFPFTLQQVWSLDHLLHSTRFFFYIFFLHTLEPGNRKKSINLLAATLLLAGFFILPRFYPRGIQLMPGLVILYSLAFTGYQLWVHKTENTARPLLLLKQIFWLTLVATCLMSADLIEELPVIRGWFAVLMVDLYPLLLCGLSGCYAAYLIKNSFTPVSARDNLQIPAKVLAVAQVSAREEEIIQLIITGHSNAEIAEQLFIASSTVKKHINNIFRKLKVQNRWQLLKLCRGIRGGNPEIQPQDQ